MCVGGGGGVRGWGGGGGEATVRVFFSKSPNLTRNGSKQFLLGNKTLVSKTLFRFEHTRKDEKANVSFRCFQFSAIT